MTSIASTVMSWRSATLGHLPVTGTSFKASPAPTAIPTRFGYIWRRVANVWATTPGLYRRIGQVIQVETNTFFVAWRVAPIHAHAWPDWASVWYHGWKWSSTQIESNPIFSARTDCSSASIGLYCSIDAKYPILVSMITASHR